MSSYDLEVVVDDGSPDPFAGAVPVVATNVPASAPRTAVTSGLTWATAYAWRVRGVDGLRVVDASIFPLVPCANTNFPTLMTAEKIADAIVRG